MDKVTANDNTADTANDNILMMTDHSETADRMEEWEDQIVTGNEEHFNESSDENEMIQKNKNGTKLQKIQSGFTNV